MHAGISFGEAGGCDDNTSGYIHILGNVPCDPSLYYAVPITIYQKKDNDGSSHRHGDSDGGKRSRIVPRQAKRLIITVKAVISTMRKKREKRSLRISAHGGTLPHLGMTGESGR